MAATAARFRVGVVIAPAGSPGAFAGYRGLLRLGAWCGLVTGLAVLLVLAARRATSGLLFVSVHTLWLEPLSAVLFLAGLAVPFALLRGRWPTLFGWPVLMRLALFLGGFGTLLLLPRLHWAAAGVLAAGIAIQLARWGTAHPDRLGRLVRVTLWPGLVGIAILAASIPIRQALRDRAALRRSPAEAPASPNVLLIFLDTVRAWELSAYGYHRPTSPTLASLATRGALFRRAVAPAPWTLPTHASVFTGRWPHELSTDWKWALDDTFPTLAEQLAQAGYLTGGFCANVKYCSRETGLARGFAHYEDYTVSPGQLLMGGTLGRLASRIIWLFDPPEDLDAEGKARTAARISSRFLSWLDWGQAAGTQQPFFAFLNFFDAHRPYWSPEEFQSAFATPGVPYTPNLLPRSGPRRPWDERLVQGSKDAYDASIAWLDSEIGKLFRSLDQRGILDNTIVVITSDHGEEFAEHGMIGHANGVARAAVMVPLVIVAPGQVPAGRRIPETVSLRDIPRTILDLLGQDESGSIPGRSLARYWGTDSMAPVEPEPVLSSLRFGPGLPDWYPVSSGPVRSVILGPWRYIVQADGREQLFDYEADSLEQRDLIRTDDGRRVGARLRAVLDSIEATSHPR